MTTAFGVLGVHSVLGFLIFRPYLAPRVDATCDRISSRSHDVDYETHDDDVEDVSGTSCLGFLSFHRRSHRGSVTLSTSVVANRAIVRVRSIVDRDRRSRSTTSERRRSETQICFEYFRVFS